MLVKVDGENINIFEYPDEATAISEAKFVSKDGFSIYRPEDGANKGYAGNIDWIAAPHWYQKGRIIMLYVGEREETLNLLYEYLGPAYAGAQ